jgi:hypothetical protein
VEGAHGVLSIRRELVGVGLLVEFLLFDYGVGKQQLLLEHLPTVIVYL